MTSGPFITEEWQLLLVLAVGIGAAWALHRLAKKMSDRDE